MLIAQAEKIQAAHYNPDVIIAIARGGLIPARILTDLLQNPLIATINVEFYSAIEKTRNEPIIKQPLTIDVQGKKVLLVDDIADSGKTLTFVETLLKRKKVSEVRCTTLYTKPCSIHEPDFFEKKTSKWVIFPWDIKETIQSIVRTSQTKSLLNQEMIKLVGSGLPKKLVDKFLNGIQKEPTK